MPTDLTQRMQQWRDGEISNAEVLGYLIEAQFEVRSAMIATETIEADKRMARLGVIVTGGHELFD